MGHAALPILLSVPVAVVTGAGVALFLWSLDWATDTQRDHTWLLFLLPAAGALIAWLYSGPGRTAAGGNNQIIDRINDADAPPVPLRMFPLVLVATLLTHLFGGSAGREGTAVQMGGSVASGLIVRLHLDHRMAQLLFISGISAGFGGVFGTPAAGAVFAIEVLALGAFRYDAIVPAVVAGYLGDLTVGWLRVGHQFYSADLVPGYDLVTILKVAAAGLLFGIASAAFAIGTREVQRRAKQLVANPVLRTTIGGVLVVGVTLLLGTRMYNGLSLELLAAPFQGESVPTFAFLFKIGLTALTLGVGFKGGEVTPLFVIGATLGATLAPLLGLPVAFAAALGFVAVFGATANTPIACVVLGASMFGNVPIGYLVIAVFLAYAVSGQRGIYDSQPVVAPKGAAAIVGRVREARHARSKPRTSVS